MNHPIEPNPWTAQAACLNTTTDIFFTHSGQRAKAICADCPVRIACLDHALADPSLHGIWGGLTARERRQINRHRKATA